MLKIVEYDAYKSTLTSERRKGLNLHKYYSQCMHKLIARWAAQMTPHQITILAFVLDRTIYHGKLSETVAFDQFLSGMALNDGDEMVFCGLNMSKNTLTLHLKQLIADDFLHAHGCVGARGTTEIRPRLFAINFKLLFGLDLADEENPMILRMPKEKSATTSQNTREIDADIAPSSTNTMLRTSKKRVVGLPDLGVPNLGGIYSTNIDTKVSNLGVAALAAPRSKVDVNSALENLRATRLAMRTERTANRPTARRQTAAASSPTSKINVQAMIDTAMALYHPTLPRVVVTDKPLGVLKKRLALSEVELEPVINWAIRFWITTASAHERSSRRRIADGTTKFNYTAIPPAPDFATLCYRFPYFLAAYRSFVVADAAGVATTREEQLTEKVQKLERMVETGRDAVRSANERVRNITRQRRPEPAPRRAAIEDDTSAPTRVRRTPRAALPLDDDLPPAWGEHEEQPLKARK